MPPHEHHLPDREHLKAGGKRGIMHVVFGRTTVVILLLLLQIFVLCALMIRLGQYIPYYLGGTLVCTTVMLVYVLNTEENPTIKLSWAILFAVVPAFAIPLYFYIRMDLGHRVEQAMILASIEHSKAHISDQKELMEQISREDKGLSNLLHYIRSNGGYIPYHNTDVTYFPQGEDKFAEMLVQLEQAEQFIFLEYFHIGESEMWNEILDILVRKAKQGVEVRVMYDGTSTVMSLPYNYPKQLHAMGIQCKVFSPLRPLVSTSYNNRDHRKILVIDGHTAFTGGVNLLDRYINREELYGHWKDAAVMIQGEAVRGFTLMFLQMWNHTERTPVYEPYLHAPLPPRSAPGYVIPYGDNPMDTENVGEMVYLDILNQARNYVYIMTPYLILDNEMLTALTFAAKRGVDVRILLPHVPDKKYAFLLAKSHYKQLLSAGVKIYEYTPGFVHSKVFLSDDRHGVVGTINLDYRSLYLHFECAAYLYKVPALQDIRRDFEATLTKSQSITLSDVKKQKLRTKLAAALLKVAAPLM